MATSIFDAIKRRTVRAPDNPLDKSTIVSVFPRAVNSEKPSLQPGHWTIPAGTVEKPSVTVIKPSSWWKDIGPDEDLIEIPVSSLIIAESIIGDYINGLLGCDMGEVRPGIFWIPGEKTLDQIKKEHSELLALNIVRQRNWYARLVELADAIWARSGGNPLTIGVLEKLAASELGVNREWLRAAQLAELVKCIMCGNLRDANYPVCPHCKAIVDPEKAKGIAFAK